MTQQTINIGAAPNDGTGDTARAGGQKINDNFTELYSTFDNTVANGKTGATTLTGYVKGNGTSPFTASATVPTSDLSGSISVANGGTGAASFTATRLLIGDGTNPVTTDAGLTFTGGYLYTTGISSVPNGSKGTEAFGAGISDTSTATTTNNTLVGKNSFTNRAATDNINVTVIGANSGLTNCGRGIVIGQGSTINNSYDALLIGNGSTISSAPSAFTIGSGITNTANSGIAVGFAHNISNSALVALGSGHFLNQVDSIGIGYGCGSAAQCEFSVGSSRTPSNAPIFRMFGCSSTAFNQINAFRVKTEFISAVLASAKTRAICEVYEHIASVSTAREFMRAEVAVSGAADVYFNGGSYTFATPVKTGGYTVATLPAGVVGQRAYVTDALAPVFLTALVGGGAVTCPAFYNGAAWVAG